MTDQENIHALIVRPSSNLEIMVKSQEAFEECMVLHVNAAASLLLQIWFHAKTAGFFARVAF
jgi:hypothetical protein